MPTQLILNPFRLTARAGGGQTAWEPGRVGPGSGTQWRAPPLEAVCSGQGISLPTPSSKSYLDTQTGTLTLASLDRIVSQPISWLKPGVLIRYILFQVVVHRYMQLPTLIKLNILLCINYLPLLATLLTISEGAFPGSVQFSHSVVSDSL